MLSFICVTPVLNSQALSAVTRWQWHAAHGVTSPSDLLSWHFVFSAFVTKALHCKPFTSLISQPPLPPPFFSVTTMIRPVPFVPLLCFICFTSSPPSHSSSLSVTESPASWHARWDVAQIHRLLCHTSRWERAHRKMFGRGEALPK